jgi:capping protein beta
VDADTDRYFEGGISSVYLWDMDDGFAGCVLLKKGAYGSALAAIVC